MALPSRRSYAGGAAACTLSSAINSSATSFSISGTTSGWPTTAGGGFYMVIDPGLSTEEKVFVGARTTGSLSSVTRGVDGTLAASHDSGATCYPVFTAVDADEANKLASTLTTKGDLLSTDGSAPTRLGVGTNGQLLVADSAETSGIKWSNTISAATVISGSTAGELLRITQTGAGAALLVEDSTNPDSTPFVVDSGGQLIVGATSLSVTSTSVTPRVQIAGTSNDACSFIIYNFANDTTTTATTWAKSRGGSFGTQGAVQSADSIGVLNFEGSDGTQLRRAVQIIAAVDGSVSSAIVPGRLIFSTMNTSGTLTERMRIDSAGQVGIGTSSSTAIALRIGPSVTGSTTGRGVSVAASVASDVTSGFTAFFSNPSTAASAFTLATLYHYFANNATAGSTSTIGDQRGFHVGPLTSGTNNYGFYGDVASGSNRWNLYMNGTANNYLAGSLGIGTTSLTGVNLAIAKTITGAATSRAVFVTSETQSDVTTLAEYFRTTAAVQNATFTLPTLMHYRATQGTFGASATVTTQYGFSVDSSLTGAATNIAYHTNLASGSNRWGLYFTGTVDNHLAGRLGIGATLTSGAMAQVTNTTAADKVLVVKGAASQTGSLLELQNSAGTAMVYVGDTGTTLVVGNTAATNVLLELGTGRTVDGASTIDLIGDTTYTDYGLRLQRASGSGGISFLSHRGTQDLRMRVVDAGFFSVYTSDTERMRVSSAGDVGINMTGFSGAKVIAIGNGTAPTANPTGGGYLYVESGALKYRGSSGTITTIANA